MKTNIRFVFISFVVAAILTACGPPQEELDATATQIAVDVFATQTAQAPTITPPFTPSPVPIATEMVTPAPTLAPTLSPALQTQQAGSELWKQLQGGSISDVGEVTNAYGVLLTLDILSERIVSTSDGLEQGELDKNQADARIQFYQHKIGVVESYTSVMSPYRDDLTPPMDSISEACRHWWLGKSDALTLSQEVNAIRQSIQPLMEALHTSLKDLGSVDMSFEQEFQNNFAGAPEFPDQALEYESSHDIFQMQRDYRASLWGMAPTLGSFDIEQGYTSPDETLRCNFNFIGIDGDFLYDFIFPDRSVVVFTNDFGMGQAVERRPLDTLPADEAAARRLVDEFFQNIMLPSLQEQLDGLNILQQTWVDSPRPMLQVILSAPDASFIAQVTESGEDPEDVNRGLLIFVDGDAIYSIIYQNSVLGEVGQTEEQLIHELVDGLTELQQSCAFK